MSKIFLDGGTHLGGGIKSISKKEGIDSTWRIHTWEANPHTYKKNLTDTKKYNNFNIQFYNSALSTYDGKIDVMVLKQTTKYTKEVVNTGQGSTTLSADKFKNPSLKESQMLEKVEINCIDFVSWIEKHTTSTDEITIKLDVEGSEYEILEKLIESNHLARIKKIYVEWHSYALQDPAAYDKRQEQIEKVLKNNNIKVISWV